jgi:hypothetical protein
MRASTTPASFASLSIRLFALAILFAFANGQPAVAQGLRFFAHQSSPHPARTTSFVSLGSAISIMSSVSPTNHADNLADESASHITENLPSRNLATLFPYQETKTSFVTEVRVPVAEFRLPVTLLGASSLRVGFFMQTLHNSDVALGPLAATQALHSLGQLRSVSLYGLGVSIPLGKPSTADLSSSLPWTALQRFIRDR